MSARRPRRIDRYRISLEWVVTVDPDKQDGRDALESLLVFLEENSKDMDLPAHIAAHGYQFHPYKPKADKRRAER